MGHFIQGLLYGTISSDQWFTILFHQLSSERSVGQLLCTQLLQTNLHTNTAQIVSKKPQHWEEGLGKR